MGQKRNKKAQNDVDDCIESDVQKTKKLKRRHNNVDVEIAMQVNEDIPVHEVAPKQKKSKKVKVELDVGDTELLHGNQVIRTETLKNDISPIKEELVQLDGIKFEKVKAKKINLPIDDGMRMFKNIFFYK